MKLFKQFSGGWGWLSNLIRTNVAMVFPSDNAEKTDSPWCEVFTVIHNIDPFDSPNSSTCDMQRIQGLYIQNFGYF